MPLYTAYAGSRKLEASISDPQTERLARISMDSARWRKRNAQAGRRPKSKYRAHYKIADEAAKAMASISDMRTIVLLGETAAELA
ncbi:MAG: hypothetical protein K0R28_947 [Paenibacillus sp.]|nr:hypothetical protein [Paenibacillus sp.]